MTSGSFLGSRHLASGFRNFGLASRRSSTPKARGRKLSGLQSLENPQNRKIVSTPRRPKDGVGVERYADLRITGEPDVGGAPRRGVGRAGGPSLPSEALAGAGLGQGLADLEAEIVHRRLLAHRKILALGLAFGLLRRARDVDRHVRLNLGMQVHGGLVQAERLDRLRQRDLVAMD